MVRFRDEREGGSDEVDFMDPWFQNAPVSRAILDLLRRLTDRFQDMPVETTDLDWTAFKALSSAGAAEGIVRLSCTYADADGPCTEYYHVRGHGLLAGMPAREFLTTEPHELVLVKARLTTTGVGWAEFLSAEKTQPEKVRGLVLTLLWRARRQPGSAHRVPPPPPSDGDAPAGTQPSASDPHAVADSSPRYAPPTSTVPTQAQVPASPASAPNGGTDSAPEAAVEEDEEAPGRTDQEEAQVPFGAPQVDDFDGRVVNWFGKRLYLGHDTQISRLFWLLARRPGVAHDLGQVQRAVDGMETSRDDADPAAYRKAMYRVRKAISKLRDRLREDGLDTHGDPQGWPQRLADVHDGPAVRHVLTDPPSSSRTPGNSLGFPPEGHAIPAFPSRNRLSMQ